MSDAISILQVVIATVLIFVLIFGLGFILNMLMKTTWLPIYLYVAAVIGMALYWAWGTGTLVDNLKKFTIVDYTPFAGGLVGAVLSGKTIKTLREKGYRMF